MQDDDLTRLICGIASAASRIKSKYFSIRVHGSERPRYRERVYCYEFYHQMRMELRDLRHTISGEMDKGSHPDIQPMLGNVKPDFIIHFPGEMHHNLTVIEVKQSESRPYQIRKDIQKIQHFMDEAQYQNGIMLLYGGMSEAKEDNRIHMMQDPNFSGSIRLMWHRNPCSRPYILTGSSWQVVEDHG